MDRCRFIILLCLATFITEVYGSDRTYYLFGGMRAYYVCFDWSDRSIPLHFHCDDPTQHIHVVSSQLGQIIDRPGTSQDYCKDTDSASIRMCDFRITIDIRTRCQYKSSCTTSFGPNDFTWNRYVHCTVPERQSIVFTKFECVGANTAMMKMSQPMHFDASQPLQLLSPLYPLNTNTPYVACKIDFTPDSGHEPTAIKYAYKELELISYINWRVGCYYNLNFTTYIPLLSGWRSTEICADRRSTQTSRSDSIEAGPGWQSTMYVEFMSNSRVAIGRMWIKLEAFDQDDQPLQGDFYVQCKDEAWPTPTVPPTTTTTPRPAFDFTPFHFTVMSYEYHRFITDKKYSCEVKFYPDPGISMERFQFRYNVSRLESNISLQQNSDGCFYKLKMTMFSVPLNKWVTEDVCTTIWGPWYRYHFAPAAMYVEFEQQDNRASGRFVSAFEVKTDTTALKGLPLGKFTWHCSLGGLPIPYSPPMGDVPEPAGQKSLAYDLPYRHVFHTSLWQRERLITLNYCQAAFWPKPGVSMDRLKFRYHIWVLQTMFPGEKDSSCSTDVSYSVFNQQLNDWSTDIRCKSDFGPWVQYNRIPAIFYLWWGPKKPGVTGTMWTAIEVSSDKKTLAETGTFGWHCADKEYRPSNRRTWWALYLVNEGYPTTFERLHESKDCTVTWLRLNSDISVKDLWFRYKVYYFQPTYDNGHDWCDTGLFTLEIVMYDVTAQKWRTHRNNACQSLIGPWYRYNYPNGVKFEYHVKRGSKRYFQSFIKYKLTFEVWSFNSKPRGTTTQSCTTK